MVAPVLLAPETVKPNPEALAEYVTVPLAPDTVIDWLPGEVPAFAKKLREVGLTLNAAFATGPSASSVVTSAMFKNSRRNRLPSKPYYVKYHGPACPYRDADRMTERRVHATSPTCASGKHMRHVSLLC
jgi:hypothetical protein